MPHDFPTDADTIAGLREQVDALHGLGEHLARRVEKAEAAVKHEREKYARLVAAVRAFLVAEADLSPTIQAVHVEENSIKALAAALAEIGGDDAETD